MMKKRLWLIVAAILISLSVVGWTVYGQKQRNSVTWEYKLVYSLGARHMTEKMLNEQGAQGWELVAFQQFNQEGATMGAGNYLFKRLK